MNLDYLNRIQKGVVWAIIPARAGSKGVTDKNIRELGEHPLIAHTIAVCILASEIHRTIVSTDSERYANIAKKYGAEVPFLRPSEYALDTSHDIGFMKHALEWFCENEGIIPEYWAHMRTTCPFRCSSIVDEAINKIRVHSESTSLLSICIPEGVLSPYKWLVRDGDYVKSIFFENNDDANRPRQIYPDAYSRSIYVDVYKSSNIIQYDSLFGNRIVPFETDETIDIDTQSDLDKAKAKECKIDKEVLDYMNMRRFVDE